MFLVCTLIKICYANFLLLDTLELSEKISWVKFNVDSNGYYIVHYEGHGWDQLITQLNQNHTLLRPKDRVGLIHDAFQLVR